ncbi:ABC transporter ATP-binding protein [Leucothrix arctica]|uniref:Multidrug ABC transporter ATP-binding protein n=1 Tax=Leucothrix arctica TaxID=1481894 RepID=A0A317CCP1_9GAMM|nr:ABC transporter ATP-binding protein [Leucothrix arctica]PWQ96316.1 multidrug ABC transporter ATP-binding protein [Leucothrix arctica]
MPAIISIVDLCKTYDTGFQALKSVNLTIERGEILALLGPNGAGKTTLISTICGLVTPTSGTVTVDGNDIIKDYRLTRKDIGLVPQELSLGAFDKVWDTVQFSRGLFGKSPNPAYIEQLLKDLSLWDKKDNELMTLSGGMKRRVLIAKALSHEPKILFLDEPTAGVDVELRKDMWKIVNKLSDSGVTIILTTHYIEEAEEIADRVGVIAKGEVLLLEDKHTLMNKMGEKKMRIEIRENLNAIPDSLVEFDLLLDEEGSALTYMYDTNAEYTGITTLLKAVNTAGLTLRDIKTTQSSLEDIFVKLVEDDV